MTRPLALKLENLEKRDVPAVFGIPWADPRHLSISFAPNGTPVDGAQSNLFSALPSSQADWQREILRAVQAWAQYANINVGVVSDSGAAIGAAGAAQNDPRFGDIRIAARPLSENVLAITVPSGFLGGTRAGDIVINSNVQFSIDGSGSGPDLYTAMLQEVGHALGMANSTDPNSPMYEYYSGPRTGLSSGDIANIQALYGARTRDVFDWTSGNDTLGNARDLGAFHAGGPGSFAIRADLTTPSDVDYFKVRADASNPYGLTFRLSVSSSLLAPRITVLDADGNVLDTKQSTDPLTGVLTISLSNVQDGAYYFVRLEAASSAFGAGNYELRFVHDPNGPQLAADDGIIFDDANSDDDIEHATQLFLAAGIGQRYNVTANLQSNDVDFYRIVAPAGAQTSVLTIVVRGLGAAPVGVGLAVFNSAHELVESQVLTNENGDYIIQVANAQANEDYYVRVTGADGATGAYRLSADFASPLVQLQQILTGTVTSASATQFKTLTANRSQIMHFVLTAGTTSTGVQAGVRLGVFNSAGHVVANLFAKAGQTATATVYLDVGEYVLRFTGLAAGGATLPALDYSLKGISLTDPIAPNSSDPANDPSGSGTAAPDFELTSHIGDYYAGLALDNLGEVTW